MNLSGGTAAKIVAVSAVHNTAATLGDANGSSNSRISDDGRYIVFQSNATNLVGAVDANGGNDDVFRRDCQTLETVLLSIKTDLTGSATGNSNSPFLSGNGLLALFNSTANDLAPGDANGSGDVFVASFNQAPVISGLSNITIAAGGSFTQNGTFTDVNGADSFAATVDYGDGSGVQALTLTNNAFTITRQYTTAGVRNVRVVVSDNVNASIVNVLVTVTSAPTTTTLTTTANPSGFQQSITFTATIAATAPGAAPISGLVAFLDGTNSLGTVTVGADGTAAFSISSLPASVHAITAVYSGDGTYDASTSAVLSQTVNPSKPTITSTLALTTAKDAPFEYVITAIGSTPITYTVSNLPAGLTFDTTTIAGAPTTTGIAAIVLTATNALGSDVQTLLLTIPKAAGAPNSTPVITSSASVTPNPGRVGESVIFTAAATDADGDLLAYIWDFGDGTAGSGASIAKTYTAAGVYTAKVTVRDDSSSAEDTVTLAINQVTGNGGPGSSVLTVQKGALKFNLKDSTPKDSLGLSGTVPMGAGFNPAAKAVTILVGDYRKDFIIDSKGKSGTIFSVSGKKARDGTFSSEALKFAVKLKNEELFDSLRALGFTNTTIKTAQRISAVPVIMVIDGDAFSTTVNFDYKASENKSGSGKLVP
jgi:hypothetical protein